MPIRKILQLLDGIQKFRSLLFLGLLFIGLNSPSHADTTLEKNEIKEDHDTKNLNKLLIDYNKDQAKVLKDASKIIQNDNTSDLTDKELVVERNLDTEDRPALKKAEWGLFDSKNYKKQIDPNILKKHKYSDALRVTLEPLQKMSEMELVKLLKENTKNTLSEVYIDRYPKLAVFTVRLIKDKESLPSLARIIDDQDRLIHFIGIMIASILIAFSLKRLMWSEGRSVTKAISLWFLRFLIITSLRIGILFFFFSSEITPTLNIAAKTFF